MSEFIKKIQALLQYQQAFGPLQGLRCFLRRRKKQGLIEMSVPGLKQPLLMRAKTSDVSMFKEVFVESEYGPLEGIDPKVIFDVGANVGYASVYFATQYPRARIIAVEPEPSNLELLRRNVAPYGNVEVVAAAVWFEPATLLLDEFGDDHSGTRVRAAENPAGGVRAITIDELLGKAGTDRIDILKVDIEGAEKEVFERSPSWLANVGVLMIELHDRFKPGCSRAVYSALIQHDFREMHFQEAAWFVNGRTAAGA